MEGREEGKREGRGQQEGPGDTGVNLGSDLCKSVARTAAVCGGEHGRASAKQEKRGEGESEPVGHKPSVQR